MNRWFQTSADFDFDFLLYFSNILSALPYSCIWIELDIFQRWIGDCRSVRILILIFCYTSQRYRRYLILVFESSWDIFQRWIGDYRPVRILILIFCYTSQINRRFLILIFESSWTFFRDRDSMLYKLIWSRYLGSVQGLHGPLGFQLEFESCDGHDTDSGLILANSDFISRWIRQLAKSSL